MDLVASLLGLVVLAPFLVIIGVLIRIESPGPALFRQVRMGKDGEEFEFYKFRTMLAGNDHSAHKAYVQRLITGADDELRGPSGAFKIEQDPRVTRVGRILRRTSIDELPQLFNVLVGDMSLVGPRPPLPYEVELYSPKAMRRLECLPGITGLWQVNGRSHTTFDEMIDLDIEYVDSWTPALDLKILWRTVGVVLGRTGAW
jgi:lipopolysaccharide/colanic/teichoic acid biosynthesis glycosyltransferase